MYVIALLRSPPSRRAWNVFFLSNPNKNDAREPVHTPVPGSGTATNIMSPGNPYLSIYLEARIRVRSTYL